MNETENLIENQPPLPAFNKKHTMVHSFIEIAKSFVQNLTKRSEPEIVEPNKAEIVKPNEAEIVEPNEAEIFKPNKTEIFKKNNAKLKKRKRNTLTDLFRLSERDLQKIRRKQGEENDIRKIFDSLSVSPKVSFL